MSDQSTRKSPFAIFQSLFTLATPIIVIWFGSMINGNVTQMEAEMSQMKAEMDLQILPVKEMKPFMDMLSATDDKTKNIMGAYGIYMLKKGRDSKIAAQMISSTQKEHLFDVLIDIGEDDSLVKQWINKFKENSANITSDQLSTLDENDSTISTNLSDYQKYLLKLTGELERSELKEMEAQTTESTSSNNGINNTPDGWLYLGNKKSKLIVDKDVNKASMKTVDYTLLKGANMRKNKPQPPNYKNQKLLRVLQEGTTFIIDTFTVDKKNHVWARIKLK